MSTTMREATLQTMGLGPAIDIFKSGTRKEDLLIEGKDLAKIWVLRKYLSDYNPIEAMEFLIDKLGKTKDNEQFILPGFKRDIECWLDCQHRKDRWRTYTEAGKILGRKEFQVECKGVLAGEPTPQRLLDLFL